IVGPEQVIQRLADAKQQIDFGHSIFPQWIAYQFLDSPTFSSHIEKLRQELKKQEYALSSSLNELLGSKVSFDSPQGGIHLWCKVNQPV
ncbi:PLP-dependent aminotransferase family protein, partial [Bacillus safensis]|nr:PLP-dependent aminotransferase family protein [Bacillus safensis]